MSRVVTSLIVLALFAAPLAAEEKPGEAAKKPEQKTVVVGAQAPAFKIKDSQGKVIDLLKLAEKGPVLVRLTCGCSGCDKELAYFQAMHKSYEKAGLTSVAVFREPDAKVEKYVKGKKLKMLYAVDTKGESWKVFETKTMPTNILVDKGGKIISIAAGCDPSGLLANRVSKQVAELLKTDAANVKQAVKDQKNASDK